MCIRDIHTLTNRRFISESEVGVHKPTEHNPFSSTKGVILCRLVCKHNTIGQRTCVLMYFLA